jgi:hypothetical protein
MHPTVPSHNQITRRWTSSVGMSGRHRSVQVDTFVGSAQFDLTVNGGAACAVALASALIGGTSPPANASAASAMNCNRGPAQVQLAGPIELASSPLAADREPYFSCVGHPINSGRAAQRLVSRAGPRIGTRLRSRAALSRMKMTGK